MPIVKITRRLHFSAAHRLARPEWSDARNERTFGACANPNWHGHNYALDVTVAGPPDPVNFPRREPRPRSAPFARVPVPTPAR